MPQQSHFQIPAPSTMFSEFGQIYEHNQASSASPGEGTPQGMLSGYLRSFVDSSKCQAPFHPMHLPDLGLSVIDKQRIRDRSSIMARHIFADKGEQFAGFQVRSYSEVHINVKISKGSHPQNFVFDWVVLF